MVSRFYPSPSSTKYYINDIEIDDLYRVDFQRTVNHQPIYGYNSKSFDFVAKGKELVNGNLILNFRYPGYLAIAILNSFVYKDILNQLTLRTIAPRDNIFTKNSFNTEELKNFIDKSNIPTSDKLKVISNAIKQEIDFKNAITNTNIANILQEKYLKTLPPKDITLRELQSLTNLESPAPIVLDILASILDYPDIYEFDLVVRYGFQDSDTYTRTFKRCVITGEGETVSAAAGGGNDSSSSAQPILEVYPFFARTIATKFEGLVQQSK